MITDPEHCDEITDINDPKCNVIKLYQRFRVFMCYNFVIKKPQFTATSIAMWLKWQKDHKPPEIISTCNNTIIGTSEIDEEHYKKAVTLLLIWFGMGLIQAGKDTTLIDGKVVGKKLPWMYKFTPKWRTLARRKGYFKHG